MSDEREWVGMTRRWLDRWGLRCLGVSQDGSPRHPLMLPYASEVTPWPGGE